VAASVSSSLGSAESNGFEAVADFSSEMKETTSEVAELFYFSIFFFY
jgi:hypothetical protein